VFRLPIYEYECEKCKKRFEVIQKMSDPPLTTCSDCSGKLNKLVSSPAGLLFKGSGWYVNDYAKKNGPSASDAKEKGESKPAASGESTKKEAPKEAPSESKSSSKDNQ
jgi:putative FmdB family regulatory protein